MGQNNSSEYQPVDPYPNGLPFEYLRQLSLLKDVFDNFNIYDAQTGQATPFVIHFHKQFMSSFYTFCLEIRESKYDGGCHHNIKFDLEHTGGCVTSWNGRLTSGEIIKIHFQRDWPFTFDKPKDRIAFISGWLTILTEGKPTSYQVFI